MSKTKNCLNCGAPFDPDKEKCAYCGTSYYDMSALTIDGRSPFMLKIKVPMGDKYCYITQLVTANIGEISQSFDTIDYMAGGRKVGQFSYTPTINTSISFTTVERKNGTLLEVSME